MHMSMNAVVVRIVGRLAILLAAPMMSTGSSIGMLQRCRMILHGGSHDAPSAGEDNGDHQEDEKAGQGSLHFFT